MCHHCERKHIPAGDVSRLCCVEEPNVLPQQRVEQLGADSHVEAGHAQGEQPPSGPGEDSTPKGHPHQLKRSLLELVAVWLNGSIVYDLAGIVWHQGLPQCGCCACRIQDDRLDAMVVMRSHVAARPDMLYYVEEREVIHVQWAMGYAGLSMHARPAYWLKKHISHSKQGSPQL